ncbi:hypothetical protein GGI23_006192 [Coemansia sp. RSA 2559]|nr:hypothetical protein GGI23_006192 [Coemansia sp. RSA 2559]
MLLQLNNSHQPTVWHPSILPLFPDLPSKFHTASVRTSEQRLGRIKATREKMAKCVASMSDAANWLRDYATLTAKNTGPEDSLAQDKGPFLSGSAERYAEATGAASSLCNDVADMRTDQIRKLQDMVDFLKGDTDIALPPNTFENDTQVVNIMKWRELPGILDKKLLGPGSASTLTLAGLKDILLNNEHIN